MEKLAAQVILFSLSGFIIFSANPGSSLFSWHPTLMIIGVIFSMSEGILLFRLIPPKWRVTIHGLIQGVGMTSAALGFYAIYQNKELNNKEHFTTWHGLVGIITLIYLFVQVVGGVIAKYAVKLSGCLKVRPSVVKSGHRYSGVLSLTLGFGTAVLGLYSSWFQSVAETQFLWTLSFASLAYLYTLIIYKTYIE